MNTQTAVAIGRSAFLAGHPAVPALNVEIVAAIESLPVGGGSAPIMRAFLKGWHGANLEAA